MAYSGNLTPQNTTAKINFVLYTQSKESFEALTNKDAGTIYFIALDKAIYLDGTYYGVTQSDLSSLLTRLDTVDTTISTHTSNISTLAQAINGTIDTVGGSIGVHNTATAGQDPVYTYTTISSALRYLDQTLEAVQVQAGTGSVASQIQSAISTFEASLDATVRGNLTDADAVSSGHNVGVKVVETDGKITQVLVVENDIASATELTGVSGRVTTAEGAITTLNGSDTTAGSVAKAVKDAKDELKGNSSSDTKDSITIEGAKKYAQDLVDTLSSTLTGADSSIWDTLNKVKAELTNPDDTAGLTSFLDKVTALINGFELDSTNQNYTTIKNYIDDIKSALETSISTLSRATVKSVNGETPTNGIVTIDGADIKVTGYSNSGLTGNVADTDTVNDAIGKVENKADTAQSTADTAVTNAAAAQSTADTAISHLTWTIL